MSDKSTSLIPIETVTPDLFSDDSLDALLEKIKQAATADEPDVSTEKGRKAIASIAYNVARSSTAIDKAGKELKAEWDVKCKAIDATRRKSKEFLSALKIEVRKPLTDWETEQERIKAEKLAAYHKAKDEAVEKQRLAAEKKEAELKAREEAIARKEREALEKAEVERAERERLELEAEHKREIAAAAEQERIAAIERENKAKSDAIEREKQAKAQAAKDAKDAAAKAERDAKAAAEKAERDKLAAVKAAEERVRLEEQRKQQKIDDDKRRAEQQRIAKELQDRRNAENKAHRRKVNKAAVSALTANGIKGEIAKQVITLIASDGIPQVYIDYTPTAKGK